MYELKQVSEKCYYINCPAKIGVYVADKDNVYLIDSGNDKEAERILSICREPLHFEKILQEVFKGYGLAMNFEQYVLVGSTVRSYLSWLKDTGKLAATFLDSMLLWQRI